MTKTKIEWADHVWNPVTGCSPLSAGCAHCYAQRMAQRLRGRYGYPAGDPFRVTAHPGRFNEPSRIKRPSRIFVCSMGDLFHDYVEPQTIARLVEIMESCPQHTFMLLTKRVGRLVDDFGINSGFRWPRNVWLGVSVENTYTAWRTHELSKVDAAKKFVSIEPLLEPIDIKMLRWRELDWMIVGPETGPGARHCDPAWIEFLDQVCRKRGIPFFDKRKQDWLAREWPTQG